MNRNTEDEMPEPSKRSIEQYYAEFPEEERSRSGMGRLEFERTKKILERFMPSPPAVVLDVGGGWYSFAVIVFKPMLNVQVCVLSNWETLGR